MNKKQMQICDDGTRITMHRRLNETPTPTKTPINEINMQSKKHRKMDLFFSMPKRKLSEPYIPPHRRFIINTNKNYLEESSSTIIVKPSSLTSWSNKSNLQTTSDYLEIKSEHSVYSKSEHLSDSNNLEANPKTSYRLNHESFFDTKTNFIANSGDNNRVKNNPSNTDQVAERVLNILDKFLNNELKKILSDLYKQIYGEVLSSELLDRWKFNAILKNNTRSSASNTKVLDSIEKVKLLQSKTVPGRLNLSKLEKEFWINIHCCKNVSELWGIIMDVNYLGKVEKLSLEMKALYQYSKTPDKAITNKSYYALLDGSWHRVKCLQCNNFTATVLFIDRGDTDIVSKNQLYKLNSQFCSLPAQAIRMALSGLETFVDFDELESILNRYLHDKSIFAKVNTVTDDYVSVQLYSNNDNNDVIDVNELIANEMLSKLLDPKLYVDLVNAVPAKICNLENGIYIQLDVPSLKYFNLLMAKAKAKQLINKDCQSQFVIRLEINKIYFVKNNEDEKWYRGKVVKFINDNELEVFLIDVGSSAVVSRKNIISLEKVCSILEKYPPQAIKVQLDQIPILSSKISSRLQNVLSKCKNLNVKFVTVGDNNNVPTVQLLKKTEHGFVISINDALLLLDEEISSNTKESVPLTDESRQPVDICNDKNLNTLCIVQSRTKFENSNAESEAEQKKPLKIDKDKISKIREMYKHTKNNARYLAIYLSLVLRAPRIPEDDYFDVHVVMSSDPFHFVIQLLRNKTLSFNKMICKITESCKSYNGPILTCESIKVGQLYACKSSESSFHDWCRVYVTEIRDKRTASVYCCDYGSYKNVDISSMVPLATQFYRLPYQAIWAELNGVKPTGKEWTVRACLKFQELTQSKNFVGRVVRKKDAISKISDKPTTVPITVETIYSLDLIDTSSNEDIDIASLLIKHGVAERS